MIKGRRNSTAAVFASPYFFAPLIYLVLGLLLLNYYLLAHVKQWSPLESWRSFKHQVKIILVNIDLTVNFYQRFSVLSATIIVVSLFCA